MTDTDPDNRPRPLTRGGAIAAFLAYPCEDPSTCPWRLADSCPHHPKIVRSTDPKGTR